MPHATRVGRKSITTFWIIGQAVLVKTLGACDERVYPRWVNQRPVRRSQKTTAFRPSAMTTSKYRRRTGRPVHQPSSTRHSSRTDATGSSVHRSRRAGVVCGDAYAPGGAEDAGSGRAHETMISNTRSPVHGAALAPKTHILEAWTRGQGRRAWRARSQIGCRLRCRRGSSRAPSATPSWSTPAMPAAWSSPCGRSADSGRRSRRPSTSCSRRATRPRGRPAALRDRRCGRR